jgi:hypothetical protein
VDGTRHQGGQQQEPETQDSLNKFIRAADQRLDDYLRRLDEGDVEEGGTGGGARTYNLAETIAVLREKRGHHEVMFGGARTKLISWEREGVRWENFAGPTLRLPGRHRSRMETFGLTLQLPYLELSSKRSGRLHYAWKP